MSCAPAYRGHQVLVVAADAHLRFFKDAAARHSSNTTAEALDYLAVNLTAPAKPGTSPQHKHVKPGQVTQARFAGVQQGSKHSPDPNSSQ